MSTLFAIVLQAFGLQILVPGCESVLEFLDPLIEFPIIVDAEAFGILDSAGVAGPLQSSFGKESIVVRRSRCGAFRIGTAVKPQGGIGRLVDVLVRIAIDINFMSLAFPYLSLSLCHQWAFSGQVNVRPDIFWFAAGILDIALLDLCVFVPFGGKSVDRYVDLLAARFFFQIFVPIF